MPSVTDRIVSIEILHPVFREKVNAVIAELGSGPVKPLAQGLVC